MIHRPRSTGSRVVHQQRCLIRKRYAFPAAYHVLLLLTAAILALCLTAEASTLMHAKGRENSQSHDSLLMLQTRFSEMCGVWNPHFVHDALRLKMIEADSHTYP